MLKALEFRTQMEKVDALVARGHTIEAAVAEVGVTSTSYALWLADHDNRIPVALDRLKHLQSENARLRKTLAKLSFELNRLRKKRPLRDVFAEAA